MESKKQWALKLFKTKRKPLITESFFIGILGFENFPALFKIPFGFEFNKTPGEECLKLFEGALLIRSTKISLFSLCTPEDCLGILL